MKRLLLLLLPLLLCGAASFNGSSQGASTTSNIELGTNRVTLSYWVRHETTNNLKLILELGNNAGSVNNTFYASCEGTPAPSNFQAFNIRGTGNNIFRSTTTIPINTWTHTVAVLNKSTTYGDLTLYENGFASGLARPYAATTNSNGTANFAALPLRVGARNTTALRFTGQIQDLAIYAGEVSAAEAYSLGAQRMSPEKVRSAKLLYYWPFSAGENPANSPDLVGGIPVNSGTKSIVQEQAPTYRK
jgi:hypothetical protein